MSELLLKGLRNIREVLHSEVKETIIYTHILIINVEEQRSSLLIQNTKETGKGFLSKHSVYKCDIQKIIE